jgi:hypothetical protein
MKLNELDPQFLKIEDERTHRYVDDIVGADGIMFLCPKCFTENNGPIGTHRVICWQPHVAQEHLPGPGRWLFQGTGVGDLTLLGSGPGGSGARSVLLTGEGCQWHGFITNGDVT